MKRFITLICAALLLLPACGYLLETDLLSPLDVGGELVRRWDFDSGADYTYDSGIAVTGGVAKLVSEFFDTNWLYRVSLVVNNDGNPSTLTQYQARVVLDSAAVDFWNGIESDGRSIRFTDSDGSTLLDFFVDDFDYAGEAALMYVEIPSIPASSSTYLYLYYGNASSSSLSSGPNTFIFYDDFESGDLGWQTYLSGSVAVIDDGGNGVLRKFNQSDANGGYRTFADSVGSFEALFSTKRVNFNGGGANRYALSDASMSGYGPQLNGFDASSTMLIEERNSGTASTISSTGSLSLLSDVWYTLSLRHESGNLDLAIYDAAGTELGSASAADSTVSSFDRFVVHGGYEFYTDDIRIRKYSSPDPSVSTGLLETTLPSNGPSISPNSGPSYTQLLGFDHTTGASHQGIVTYQLSNDGLSWYWWNGSLWSFAGDASDSNDIATVDEHIAQFVTDVGTGVFHFRAYLLSDGAQPVELESVELLYL
jgi:hypothetical protein